jgi:hypothetical protein
MWKQRKMLRAGKEIEAHLVRDWDIIPLGVGVQQ